MVLSRRNCAPRWVLLVRKVLAAIFNALVIRLLVGKRPFPMILSPLIRLSGQSRSQETKWCSVSHLLISEPASLRIVVAVITSMLWLANCYFTVDSLGFPALLPFTILRCAIPPFFSFIGSLPCLLAPSSVRPIVGSHSLRTNF